MTDVLIATTLASWKLVLRRADSMVEGLSEEGMERRVAPDRNRVRYVIGHLTAVHDKLLPSLGIGEMLHPELEEAYLKNPDGALADPVSVVELKAAWGEVNSKLTAAFEGFRAAEWVAKHALVSEEDFVKDPTRNRLAMVLSRTNHASFHLGQIVLVK